MSEDVSDVEEVADADSDSDGDAEDVGGMHDKSLIEPGSPAEVLVEPFVTLAYVTPEAMLT